MGGVLLATRAVAAVLVPLTLQSRQFIAPVHAAFARVEAAQARLPRPQSTREKLERLYDLDQAGRDAIVKLRFDDLPPAQRVSAMNDAAGEIIRHDLANQAALKALSPQGGWFATRVFGPRAVEAAWLVAQHSDMNPQFQREVLASVERSFRKGEMSGVQCGYLYDRVALAQGRRQRCGSQLECFHGRWRPQKLEGPALVDRRRAQIGIHETEAVYLERAGAGPCG